MLVNGYKHGAVSSRGFTGEQLCHGMGSPVCPGGLSPAYGLTHEPRGKASSSSVSQERVVRRWETPLEVATGVSPVNSFVTGWVVPFGRGGKTRPVV